MIRTLLLILLLLSTLPVYGQLNGTYVHNYGLGAKVFTFGPDHAFSYTFGHCTGRNSGSGHYVRRWGKLTLYFETDSSFVESVTSKTTCVSENNDTTVIHVSVLENIEPGYRIITVVIDSEGKEKLLYSDIDGQAHFELCDLVFACCVYLRSGEDKQLLTQLSANGTYKIDVQVPATWEERYETGDVLRYSIKKKTKNSFCLRDIGGQQSVLFEQVAADTP